jgi:hypothetical protein
MELRHLGVTGLLARAGLFVEHLGKLLDRLSLPGCNLGRMQFVLGRQLRNRLVALDRLKRDLGERGGRLTAEVELKTIRASRSWRITAPLRRFKRLLWSPN